MNSNSKGSLKILVADDDAPTRMLLRQAISQWGYNVIEAGDGEEAWKILKNVASPPQLLLIDWLMPVMDGIALCEHVRRELKGFSYIILLTQLSGSTNIHRALEAGADEFLSKPFNMAELRNRLDIGARIVIYENTLLEQRELLKNIAQLTNSVMKTTAEMSRKIQSLKENNQSQDTINEMLQELNNLTNTVKSIKKALAKDE